MGHSHQQQVVAQALKNPDTPTENLVLSRNEIGDDGAKAAMRRKCLGESGRDGFF